MPETAIVSEKEFRFRVYQDHAALIRREGFRANVFVPSVVCGVPVTEIEQDAFRTEKAFSYVVELPESLREIKDRAFRYATRLMRLRIPPNVCHIGEEAFADCKRLSVVWIEEGVKEIGARAFCGCSALELIRIPSSVQEIGDGAFSDCTGVTIGGAENSFAEQYAAANGLAFRKMTDEKRSVICPDVEPERRLVITGMKCTRANGKTTFSVQLEGDQIERRLWFRFDEKFEEYLCKDRCDGVVVCLFLSAMKWGYDVIESPYPISEKLYYHLKWHVIPQFYRVAGKAYPRIRLEMPLTRESYHGTRNATGMSRGVDSFATLYEYGKCCELEDYRVDLLTHFQTGAHHGIDFWDWTPKGKETPQELYEHQMGKTQEFCDRYGYELLYVDSNLDQVLKQVFEDRKHGRTQATRNLGMALLFQKGIRRYYHASTHTLDEFCFSIMQEQGEYEQWLIPLLSTESTELYEANQDWSRIEKLKKLCDFEECHDYLQVCVVQSGNCGICSKCMRTLVQLDALGDEALEKFRNSFDIDTYRREHRAKWFRDLAKQKDASDPFKEEPNLTVNARYYDDAFARMIKIHPELFGQIPNKWREGVTTVRVRSKRAQFREAPSKKADIIFEAKLGDMLPYAGEWENWIGIYTENGEIGYVFADTACRNRVELL